jgi:hypothetical protein
MFVSLLGLGIGIILANFYVWGTVLDFIAIL